MKKTIKLQDLDCANCAAKLEHEVAALEGVSSVQVNFMSQKMTLDVPEEQFAAVLDQTKKIARKVDPDIVILG